MTYMKYVDSVNHGSVSISPTPPQLTNWLDWCQADIADSLYSADCATRARLPIADADVYIDVLTGPLPPRYDDELRARILSWSPHVDHPAAPAVFEVGLIAYNEGATDLPDPFDVWRMVVVICATLNMLTV